MAEDPQKNYFLERTKGAVKDNFIIQLSQFKLYENGNLIQQGAFPRDYDDFDITLILKEDTLILQCFGYKIKYMNGIFDNLGFGICRLLFR